MILSDYTSRIRTLYPSIVVRAAQRDDAAFFVRLFNVQYKRKTSEGYFYWQFFDTPVPSKLFTAWDGNMLVGFYGVKLLTITGGRKAGFAIDMLVEESWRKRGIAYLLEEEVERFCYNHGAVLISALPNNFGNAAFKALGWKSIAKVDTLVLTDENQEEHQEQHETLGIVPSTKFAMSEEYFHWRFAQHPYYRYNKIGLDDSNFVLTKVFNDAQSGNTFIDIVYMRSSEDQREALLRKVVRELRTGSGGSITAWALPHTSAFGLLFGMGFVGRSQERYFCVKLLTPGNDDLLNINNWELNECDAEIF